MIEREAQDEGRGRASGRYAVYDAIAAGGMATVHLARLLGPAGFSRVVAIKRLHQAYAQSAEFVSMFLDEARLVARIKHPNVVPTLDVIAGANELSIVMEYVPGECLSRLLRTARAQNTPVPLRVVGAVMSAILHGLHAAHEATSERGEPLGIVHRDVSPQNVQVGADGVPRLLDFGIAKAAGRMQETRDGVLKGKIAYMAPEQLHGAPATRATDIYSAGVILWEMLSGERFHDAETDVSLIVKALSGRQDAPSKQAWGASAARACEPKARVASLDEIALRSLAIDPGERYATARDMALALERAVPLATPSEVAAWVEELAADALAERRDLVRAVECGEQDDTKLSDLLRPNASASSRAVAATVAAAVAVADGEAVTRVQPASSRTGPIDSNLTPPPITLTHIEADVASFRPKRRVPIAIAGAATLMVLGIVAAFGAHPKTSVPPAVAAVASPPPPVGAPETAIANAPVAAAATPAITAEQAKPDAGVTTTTVATKPAHVAPARPRRRADLDIRTER